jgi:hypothetical protein
MQPDTTQSVGASPTRSVSQWERAVLAQWFAGTERAGEFAIAAAYVSERSRDDPKLRNMIVIAVRDKADVAYLVHRPLGESVWILTCGRTQAEFGRFRTLPEALNVIRPQRTISEATADVVPSRPNNQIAQVSLEQ